jgi:hypothetical protein
MERNGMDGMDGMDVPLLLLPPNPPLPHPSPTRGKCEVESKRLCRSHVPLLNHLSTFNDLPFNDLCLFSCCAPTPLLLQFNP